MSLSNRTFLPLLAAAAFVPGTLIAAEDSPAKRKFLQHSQVVGNKKCIECHESEIKAWQKTKHYDNKDLHTNPKAAEIARKMGITTPSKVRTSALCTQCHFTVQKIGAAPAKAIDGVSCESCHGGAKDWLDLHNVADRREPDDSAAKLAERVAKSTAAGMIYPDKIHQVAENCYSCHIVTDEKLVNVGGHPAGSSDFELASWAGGEVRHNFFKSKGATNADTPANRKRMLYIVGTLIDLEYSLRGLARAKEKADYGKAMGRRCGSTRERFNGIMTALGDAAPAELKSIAEKVNAPGLLKFFNVGPLTEAADAIDTGVAAFVKANDGSAFGAVDKLIPTTVKGAVFQP